MAVYAIGDVHGCLPQLEALLAVISFDPHRDRLWFVGDLINRGPDPLGVVRRVMGLGHRADTLMGNHEIQLLLTLANGPIPQEKRCAHKLTDAPDFPEIHEWLKKLPLFARDGETGFYFVHAGLHPSWSMEEAFDRALELSRALSDPSRVVDLYKALKAGAPVSEPGKGAGDARLIFNANVFTRARLCSPDGRFIWPFSLDPPADMQPWYAVRRFLPGERVVYGHWAAAGLTLTPPHAFGLDSGCVYGGMLTAMRLDHPDLPVFQVPSPQYATLE